jgi:hypothetical protein
MRSIRRERDGSRSYERETKAMEPRLLNALEKVEIQEVESRYEWTVDEGRLDTLLALFTENAELSVPARSITRRGRTEIAEWFRKYFEEWGWRNRRHYVSNFDIGVRGDVARVRFYYFMTYELNGRSCIGWGNYDDTLVKQNGIWLIASKRISSAASRPLYLDEGWAGLEQMPPSPDEWQAPHPRSLFA